MLACDKTMTWVQREYDKERDKDSYSCTVIHGVSWFSKLIVGMEGKGLTGRPEFKVRIPEPAYPLGGFQTGDIFVLGEVAGIERLAELAGREHFTVLSVSDNRRGGRPHWAVSGA